MLWLPSNGLAAMDGCLDSQGQVLAKSACHVWGGLYAGLRKLLKEMLKRLPLEEIKQHGEMCPGGDLRMKRNRWLYEAIDNAKKGLVLRECKIQLIVGYLSFKHQLGRLLRTAADQQQFPCQGVLE